MQAGQDLACRGTPIKLDFSLRFLKPTNHAIKMSVTPCVYELFSAIVTWVFKLLKALVDIICREGDAA